jgi:25S rRNA (uracil2843-N3)-methyltransferase
MAPRRRDVKQQISAKPQTTASKSKNVTTASTTASKPKEDKIHFLPIELQQLILDHFTRAFPCPNPTDLKQQIQTVKGHLYNRDFASAFSKPEYLDAYALRWSAARALGYAKLFAFLSHSGGLSSLLPDTADSNAANPAGRTSLSSLSSDGADSVAANKRQVLCIGGGAGAELVALCASTLATSASPPAAGLRPLLSVTLLDIADWSTVASKLEVALTTTPTLSQYASAAAKASNGPFVERQNLEVSFVHTDVLDPWDESLRTKVSTAGLVTIMFTLNELFSASRAKATAMLLSLSDLMRIGSELLVVDSPGSYSEVGVGRGSEGKKYPMKFLLQHTLMEVAKGKWELVYGEESRWFRVGENGKGEGLRYALELENMRYQVWLYRRI